MVEFVQNGGRPPNPADIGTRLSILGVNWGNDRRGLIGGLVSGFSKMERLLVGPPVRLAAAACACPQRDDGR